MEDLKKKILEFMNKNKSGLHKVHDIAKLLKIKDKDTVKAIFNGFEEEGKIFRVRGQGILLLMKRDLCKEFYGQNKVVWVLLHRFHEQSLMGIF